MLKAQSRRANLAAASSCSYLFRTRVFFYSHYHFRLWWRLFAWHAAVHVGRIFSRMQFKFYMGNFRERVFKSYKKKAVFKLYFAFLNNIFKRIWFCRSIPNDLTWSTNLLRSFRVSICWLKISFIDVSYNINNLSSILGRYFTPTNESLNFRSKFTSITSISRRRRRHVLFSSLVPVPTNLLANLPGAENRVTYEILSYIARLPFSNFRPATNSAVEIEWSFKQKTSLT